VNVIRCDDLQLEFLGEFQQVRNDLALLGDAVVLDFDEIIFAAKDVGEPRAGIAGVLVPVVQQVLGHERGQAAREADEPSACFASVSRSVRGL